MFESEFERLLCNYRDSLNVRSRFSGVVKDFFPGQQMQVNLILAAYDLGIAQEIENINIINNAFAYRFVKRLIDEYGTSRLNADWVISVWCVCYGHKILGKPCEIKINSGKNNTPVITEEKSGASQYRELFQYEKSSTGDGLAVTGFTGGNNKMIIFQNRSINIPVVEIKDGAFSENSVEEVIMTEGFRRIGRKAFFGCTSLRQIILPVSLKNLGDYALCGCKEMKNISLPVMLEQIGAYALASTGLKTVQIPKTVYWIGEGAFSDCKTLDRIEINENISRLPAKIFQGCESLKKVKLQEQMLIIEDYAFADCSSLESIYIPDSVTSIGENTFSGVNDKFVLMCSYSSYAEEYARKKKLKYQLV